MEPVRHPLLPLGVCGASVALAAAPAVLAPNPAYAAFLGLVALAAPAALTWENRLLRRAARRHRTDLAEVRRRKDEFLALLGHELRNPLAAARNAHGVLRLRGSPDPSIVPLCDVIDRQLVRLTRLVDDLLDAARVTQGRLTLRKERVDFVALVSGVAEARRAAAREKGQRLETDLPDAAVELDADPVRLEQVVDNLLENAVRFTPAGGRVGIHLATPDGHAALTVRDDGIGIPAETLPHVFDLFTQAGRPPGRPAEGLGIGLTLVRGIVEMHGGRVEARSEGSGRGSEFTVRLPLPPRA